MNELKKSISDYETQTREEPSNEKEIGNGTGTKETEDKET
jgi:hypothetical protein